MAMTKGNAGKHASKQADKQREYYKRQIERLEVRCAALERVAERYAHGEPIRWTAFQRCEVAITALADSGAMSLQSDAFVVWKNSIYTVTCYRPRETEGLGRIVHLSARRNDGAAIHDWRDFQRIKNELCGPETEAIELYPAESRLVDGANQYHLWVFLDCQIPVGFGERLIATSRAGGIQQRPFAADQKPSDADTDATSIERLKATLRDRGLDECGEQR